MRNKFLIVLGCLFMYVQYTYGQCSMCTKTAAGLDNESAQGLNMGIIFLALMPLTIILIVGYKWWQRNKNSI